MTPEPVRAYIRHLEASLDVLAELAERSQVIFFTHHRHMQDQARHKIHGSLLQVHRL